MDHHAVAAVSLTGISLDVLGGLYLAYDLLGGQHGPLRLLTRMVTYSIVFGAGYGLGLGLLFGAAAGVTTGLTVALELHRTAGRGDHYSLPWEALFSALRGLGFVAGLYWVVGLRFAIAFGVLITTAQVIAYSRGMRPSMDYEASRRLRLSRRQLWGIIVRTFGYTLAALVCAAWVGHLDDDWLFAVRIGLVTGAVTAVGIIAIPYIEYYADNLPERRLGVFGIALVFCGFALQSFQYWLTMLDIAVQ
jgi:hypothetical protein